MMFFKLSLKNIHKSIKDYTIYFLTLVLGVAIFYVFNALDSQNVMMRVSESTREIMKLMVTMLAGVSVGVALILGFLIVYANNFLIRRRKKEFAVYMLLGMGKRQISRVLLGETLLIGMLSLGVGLLLGICASQFMSILVAKMFEADLTGYTFSFSSKAMWKTVLYFGVMYVIVVLFNSVAISRYRLIDLFQASHRTEKRKIRSSVVSVLIFVVAACMLGYAYYQVAVNTMKLNRSETLGMIALGCVGTFLVFWSMSGFLLNLCRNFKSFYHKGLNAFVLRQVHSNINTAVFSMTVICLLFFVTIVVLSSGLALNNAFKKDLQEMCPRDCNFWKTMDVSLGKTPEGEQIYAEESELTVVQTMERCGADLSLLQPGYVEITIYTDTDITYSSFFGKKQDAVIEQFPLIRWNTCERIVGISEYNRLAAFYGQPLYEVEEDEYVVICSFTSMKKLRDMVLADGEVLQIGERILKPKYGECQAGFLEMSMSHAEMGVILVPDSVIEEGIGKNLSREYNFLAADYVGESKEEKKQIEKEILSMDVSRLSFGIDGMTRIAIYESSVGLSAIVTFIAIYLGIVFLIAGAALLALKELAESTDNKERYLILDKIGADRGMQRRALLGQMGIFFGMPMLLAVIHSIFGIRYAHNLLSMYAENDVLVSIIVTAAVLILVYGGYFLATYFGSCRIIEER